jgi:hypothetical protein
MKLYHKLLAAVVAACFMSVAAFAAEASPAGTWKWTPPGRGGNPGVERTVKLDLKDGKLTGMMAAVTGGQFEIPETAISEASFKDGVVAFSVTMEFNGNKFTTKYSGKLEGDTIKGSTERPGRGEGAAPMKADWVATRAK